ncbi:T6SS immunity protein Tli4 family protein [Janthinobacterium sp. 17J80-10]|uniref:T6SS immunity protein Tli4 family protein n=1 Tax=Janthinobacterium sp. 17J80-10 TaxID=2497863 RepID=UPI0010056480|nr:T6SS immunity protein Tli4 family protein [Janthinobacterium sp. 17J80-10]QAU34920.1 hypothetical protein EKL02_12400 [Janthinobacterium sp. 17J80-10]
MMKVSKKRFVAAGLFIVALLVYFHINPIAFPANAEEKKNMEPYIQNMKTQCYGRFLVDVPQESTREGNGSYEYGFGKVSVELQAGGLQHFQAYITGLEKDLASQYIRNGASKLTHAESFSDSGKLLASYANEAGIGFNMLGLVKKENVLFKVTANGSDKSDLDTFSRNLQELIPYLKPLADDAIPTGPGFCMNGGIITASHKNGEYYSRGFTLPKLPGLYFSFTSNVNRDKVWPGILDRESSILKRWGELVSLVKTLRKARRTIDGSEAQEWLMRYPDDDGTYKYSFELEIPGKPHSLAEPNITVMMTIIGKDAGSESEPGNITEAEALLLWDAVTSTIRLRPGAI